MKCPRGKSSGSGRAVKSGGRAKTGSSPSSGGWWACKMGVWATGLSAGPKHETQTPVAVVDTRAFDHSGSSSTHAARGAALLPARVRAARRGRTGATSDEMRQGVAERNERARTALCQDGVLTAVSAGTASSDQTTPGRDRRNNAWPGEAVLVLVLVLVARWCVYLVLVCLLLNTTDS